jgi:hypothetical protein
MHANLLKIRGVGRGAREPEQQWQLLNTHAHVQHQSELNVANLSRDVGGLADNYVKLTANSYIHRSPIATS